ncbi:MAG: hypothetical protein AB7G37_20970 [Solirubrobacteraceae bacterium]
MAPVPFGAPNDILAAGLQTLAPALVPHGFEPTRPQSGRSSGGPFATASFVGDGRALHLSLRGTSLIVRYDLAGNELDHAAYMRALLGPAGKNAFPAYAADPAASFEALLSDLRQFATDFVSGTGHEYLRCWTVANARQARGGLKQLSDTARELDH